MTKPIHFLQLIFILPLLFPGCGGEDASSMSGESGGEVKARTAARELAASTNDFGLSLLETICSRDRDGNVFISPASVSMALTMAMNGAGGTTRDAMEAVLGIEGIDVAAVNRGYSDLAERFGSADSKVNVEIANSLWFRKGLPIDDDYVKLAESSFDAKVRELDFSLPGAPDAINSWVSENTNGKIEEIVRSINSDIVLFLINAIYFRGTWTVEFDRDMTRDEPFHTASGETVSCRMMGRKDELAYCETDFLQAVELPYGAGKFSMLVLLPRPDIGLDSLLSRLSVGGLTSVIDSLAVQEGRLDLPKFTMEYDITLNEALKNLGMSAAFDPQQADFTGIVPRDKLFIDEVKHRTFVEVNEEGTEAAAATSVGFAVTAVRPEGFTMRVDRPFVFLIRDTGSDMILFAGRITRPVLD